jgi:hypothetical protein
MVAVTGRCNVATDLRAFFPGAEVWKTALQHVGFDVLTVVVVNVAIFWDIAPCSP